MDIKRIAANFIRIHGKDNFIKLIELFRCGASGEVIAKLLGVTRQRVNVWKHAFGEESVTYTLKPEIESFVSALPEDKTN